MGKSITCNYHVTVNLANGKNPIIGVMSLKEVKSATQNEAHHYGTQVVKIDVFAQTKAGERVMKKDFLIIDAWGKVNHYSMGDTIPAYSF